MSRFAVSAVGLDRPGIVAAVTAVLAELECNLEDTAMAILGGQFTMMLLVVGPEELDADALEHALGPAAEGFRLELSVRSIDGSAQREITGDLWTVSVHGADHPGIVHGVATALAEKQINIVDLTTRVIDGEGGPVYLMVIDVTLPTTVDGDTLQACLDDVAGRLGVVCTAHDASSDIF